MLHCSVIKINWTCLFLHNLSTVTGWATPWWSQSNNYDALHQQAGEPEDHDEQSSWSEPQHPVWSFPRFQGKTGPMFNAADMSLGSPPKVNDHWLCRYVWPILLKCQVNLLPLKLAWWQFVSLTATSWSNLTSDSCRFSLQTQTKQNQFLIFYWKISKNSWIFFQIFTTIDRTMNSSTKRKLTL